MALRYPGLLRRSPAIMASLLPQPGGHPLDLYGFFAAAAFLFGLLFGSFLNVCIYRLPRGLSIVSPRSACPQCHTLIAAYDNIPLLSWVLLRGRCRHCKAPISARYAAVELLTGAMFLASYLAFGGPTLASLKAFVFSFLVLGLVFTDAETHLLPDALTLPGIVLGLGFSVFVPLGSILEQHFTSSSVLTGGFSWQFLSFTDSLLGAAIGGGMIYGVGEAYFRLRGIEGMGFGDVKLMAMVGAFLGAGSSIFVLFGASVVGAVYGIAILMQVRGKRLRRYARVQRPDAAARAWQSASLAMQYLEIPFGVFLGGMALVAMFFGTSVLHWYLGLFR